MSNYLSKLYAKPKFQDIKALMAILLRFLPEALRYLAKQAKGLIKGLTVGGTLFEQLGFSYVGPIDGHNMDQLLPVLRTVKALATGPTLIHVLTQKGQRLWSSCGGRRQGACHRKIRCEHRPTKQAHVQRAELYQSVHQHADQFSQN